MQMCAPRPPASRHTTIFTRHTKFMRTHIHMQSHTIIPAAAGLRAADARNDGALTEAPQGHKRTTLRSGSGGTTTKDTTATGIPPMTDEPRGARAATRQASASLTSTPARSAKPSFRRLKALVQTKQASLLAQIIHHKQSSTPCRSIHRETPTKEPNQPPSNPTNERRKSGEEHAQPKERPEREVGHPRVG
jgi:hypothetical protein